MMYPVGLVYSTMWVHFPRPLPLGVMYMRSWRAPTLQVWNQVRVGDPELRVRELAGLPQREYEPQSAPKDWCSKEFACRDRPITGRVLIYHGHPDLTMIVWVGVTGSVEDVFIGGS